MEGILKAGKSGDQESLNGYLNSLLLPDPETWFKRVFGEQKGASLAKGYARQQSSLPSQLSAVFAQAVQDRMTEVDVRKFEKACEPDADESEYPVLAARERPEPLYEVRLTRGAMSRPLWFFAYVDGGFRYIGNMPPPLPVSELRSLRGKRVEGPKVVHQVEPEYPLEPARAPQEGNARLWVIVGIDGNVKGVQVVHGRCALAEAAVKAVKKWRYAPALVEGKPVEYPMMVTVAFNVRRP